MLFNRYAFSLIFTALKLSARYINKVILLLLLLLFVGCYRDSNSKRAMSNYYGMVPNSIASVDTCIATCRARGTIV